MNRTFTTRTQQSQFKSAKAKKVTSLLKKSVFSLFTCCSFVLSTLVLHAQTSWKGTTSTAWATSTNWTSGVPTSAVDAIIGDRSITNYPVITVAAVCKSITIGNGTFTGKLTMSQNLTASGNVSIGTTGTLTQNSSILNLTGNWSNSGIYTGVTTTSSIIFSGTAQAIGGSVVTNFRAVTENAGDTITLHKNMSADVSVTVNGLFDPNESPTYQVSGTAVLTVGATGTVEVNGASADVNYVVSGGATLSIGSTVEYGSTTVDQTIYNGFSYSTLKISGTGIKSLTGDLVALGSSASSYGNLIIAGGTLDLNSFDANRGTSVAGGTLSVANGGKIIIEGNNSLPLNYATYTFSTGSTVEYGGTSSQTITAANYYNLTSSSTGARIMASTGAIGIAGTFTTGTNSYTTTGSNIDLNGAGAQTIPALTYHSLTLSGGNTKTTGGNLSIINGLALGANTTLAVGSYNITLKSTAANTARVATIPATSTITYGTGKFVVERYISSHANRAYRLLGPSVVTTTSIKANWQENASNLILGVNVDPNPGYGTQITGTGGNANGFDATTTNSASVYTFNQATGGWANVTNTNVSTFSGRAGYLIFMRGDRSIDMNSSNQTSNTTLRASGQLLTGDQVYSSLASNGAFSLIPNPYASPIDWTSIYTGSATTNFENYYTYWDPNVNKSGGYVTVTSTGIVSPSNKVAGTTQIQSGEAFFIKTKAGITSPSLTISEAHKGTTNNINIFSPTQMMQTLGASLYSPQADGTNLLVDGVVAAYNDNFSKDVDDNDALEIANWYENVAIARNGKMLSIETRPSLTTADTIPLSIARLNVQNYQWQINTTNIAGSNLQALLIDKFTNASTALSLDSLNTITFSVTSDPASSAATRFMIIFAPYSVLPVTITSVKASEHNNAISVEWTTENESNINKYEVEKSVNGTDFKAIGVVKSLNSQVAANYNLVDANPVNGNNFYRIKTTDLSGNVKYTQVVKVAIGSIKVSDVTIYPNPVAGQTFQLELSNFTKGTYSVSITNKLGQEIYSRSISHTGGTLNETIQLPSSFAAGIYNLKVQGTDLLINKQLYKK